MHKTEGLDRFPKVVIDHFPTRPWILATLGKSLSGRVGGVSIKKQSRPSDFWVSRLEIELLCDLRIRIHPTIMLTSTMF